MANSEDIRKQLAEARAKFAAITEVYNDTRKSLSKIEDVMVETRELIRRFREELEVADRIENTVLEVDYEEQDIASFKERHPAVLDRLEKSGTAVIKDPITEWVKRNKDLVTKYVGHHLAVSSDNIILANKSRDIFAIKLSNLEPSIRHIALIFYADDYLDLSTPNEWVAKHYCYLFRHFNEHVAIHGTLGVVANDPVIANVRIRVDVLGLYGQVMYHFVDRDAIKQQVYDWVDKNRSRLLKMDSFEGVAAIVAKELFHNNAPTEDELAFMTECLHGTTCGCPMIESKMRAA